MKRANLVLSSLVLLVASATVGSARADTSGETESAAGQWLLASNGVATTPATPEFRKVIRDCRSVHLTSGDNVCGNDAGLLEQASTVEALVRVGSQPGTGRAKASAYSF